MTCTSKLFLAYFKLDYPEFRTYFVLAFSTAIFLISLILDFLAFAATAIFTEIAIDSHAPTASEIAGSSRNEFVTSLILAPLLETTILVLIVFLRPRYASIWVWLFGIGVLAAYAHIPPSGELRNVAAPALGFIAYAAYFEYRVRHSKVFIFWAEGCALHALHNLFVLAFWRIFTA